MPLWAWFDTPLTVHFYAGSTPGILQMCTRVLVLVGFLVAASQRYARLGAAAAADEDRRAVRTPAQVSRVVHAGAASGERGGGHSPNPHPTSNCCVLTRTWHCSSPYSAPSGSLCAQPRAY